jgi:hypothetical protein
MKPKKIFIAILIIALLSGLAYAGVQSQKNSATNRTTPTKSTEKQSKQNEKKTGIESTSVPNESKPVEKEKKASPSYEGESPNNSQTLTGAISYSSVAGDNLIIRTTINQAVGSGTCNLTLKNGAKTVTKTSGITQDPSSSTCEGFNVSTAELESGNWSIIIDISGGGKTGQLTGSVRI